MSYIPRSPEVSSGHPLLLVMSGGSQFVYISVCVSLLPSPLSPLPTVRIVQESQKVVMCPMVPWRYDSGSRLCPVLLRRTTTTSSGLYPGAWFVKQDTQEFTNSKLGIHRVNVLEVKYSFSFGTRYLFETSYRNEFQGV